MGRFLPGDVRRLAAAHGLKPALQQFAVWLASFAQREGDGDTWTVRHRLEHLAEVAGVDRRTIQRRVAALTAAGLVERVDAPGWHHPHTFRFVLPDSPAALVKPGRRGVRRPAPAGPEQLAMLLELDGVRLDKSVRSDAIRLDKPVWSIDLETLPASERRTSQAPARTPPERPPSTDRQIGRIASAFRRMGHDPPTEEEMRGLSRREASELISRLEAQARDRRSRSG